MEFRIRIFSGNLLMQLSNDLLMWNKKIYIKGKKFYLHWIHSSFNAVSDRTKVSRRIISPSEKTFILLKLHLSTFSSVDSDRFLYDYFIVTSEGNWNGKLLFSWNDYRPRYTEFEIDNINCIGNYYLFPMDIELISINTKPLTITDEEYKLIQEEVKNLYLFKK